MTAIPNARRVTSATAPPVNALYVDKDHGSASDATSRASNTASSPWSTLGRAAWGNASRNSQSATECAQPGDTVIVVASGTPYVSAYGIGGDEQDLVYNPRVGGTAGNVITFKASVRGGVQLTLAPGLNGNMIGCKGSAIDDPANINKGYVTWDGFVIDENDNAASNGWPLMAMDAKFVTFQYCTVTGDLATTADNHCGVRIERAMDITVKNCRLIDFVNDGSTNELNGCGVEMYHCGRILLEHNEITGCGSGLFVKAPAHLGTLVYMDWITMRYNLIYDCAIGMGVHRAPMTLAKPCLVYQNIVRDCDTLFTWFTFSDSTSPKHVKVINNTFRNGALEATTTGNDSTWNTDAANEFYNNIVKFVNPVEFMNSAIADAGWTTAKFNSDRNVFNAVTSPFFINGSGNRTFATWQSTFGYDPNSITTAPTFDNEGANDLHLTQNGQAALTLGRVKYSIGGTDGATIPAGAYITGSEQIGIET